MIPFLLLLIFLCWGSFLNVVAYRLIVGLSLTTPRSHCPSCSHQIAWYDLIPIISWIILRGQCRACACSISWLYPFIELLTPLLLLALYYTVAWPTPFLPYFVLFSALIVTIRSDLETMLISQYVTLFLIPFAIAAAAAGWLPLSAFESIMGALFGYACLYIPAKIFSLITGKDGMGQGDMELLACIGSFLGATGVWSTLLIGSVTGSLFGIGYLIIKKADRSARIPFGPFLALGAIVSVLLHQNLIHYLLAI